MKVIRVTTTSGKVYHVGKAQGEKLYFTWDVDEVSMIHHLALRLCKKILWFTTWQDVRIPTYQVASLAYVEIP